MDGDSGAWRRWPWYAPAAAVVLVLTVLGTVQPFGTPVLRAASGLIVGLVVVLLAAWVNRRDARRRFVADGTLFLGALLAGGLFGTGFIFLPLLHGLLADAPQMLPTIVQPPLGIELSMYYFVANPLMETIVIPLALLANWDRLQRRALLIVAAVVFYGMRVWSYIYFVPIFVGSADLPAGQPFPPAVLEQFAQFTNLSWIRLFIDGLTCVAFLLALRVGTSPASSHTRGAHPAAVAG